MSDLLGRDRELATALEVIVGPADEEAVLIEGVAGIGKTIAFDAVVSAARERGVEVLQARPAEAEARVGLLGLHDLLDPLLPDALRVLPGVQRERLEIALGRAAGEGTAGLDEGMLAVPLCNLLRARAGQAPIVLAIDDLQWLDASTAALLEMAIRRLGGEHVRVLATRRASERARLDLARVYRDRLRTVRLGGLSVGALHQLIASRLGRSLARPALIRLHSATQGNPLYALELARELLEGTQQAIDAAVPPDVGALLGRRVARLSRTARDVVTVVAMTSKPDPKTIARALDVRLPEVERSGDAAVAAGLLEEVPWGLGLAHPLVGAATIAGVTSGRRRELHRRLAGVVRDPDQAAVHLALSTLGQDERVAATVEAAADRMLRRGATIDAAELFERAIRLTPPAEGDAIVVRRLGHARALLLAGDTRGAVAEFRMIDIDAIPDRATMAEAILLFGVVQRYLGEHAAALSRHEDALGWVTDSATRARLHLRLSWLNEHDLRESLDHATSALALLDPDKAPLDYSFALLLAARLRLHLGLGADHESIARGAALQADAGLWDWNLSTTPIDWAVWMDDWDQARALLDAGARAAELAGDETSVGALLRRRIEVETWSGALRRAAELVDTAVEQAESTQQLPSIASAKARRALVRAHMGDLEAAEAEAAEAYALADGLNIPPIRGYAATAVAAAALGRRDYRRVDDIVSRATASLDATGDVDQAAHRFHTDHLEALIALGDLDRARALADRLRRRGELGPRPTWSGVAARGCAAIAVAEGRLEVAQGHIEEALRFHAPAKVPLETARTLTAAADLDRRLGRRKSAAARLATALDTLDQIGAAGLAAATRADLRRLAPDHGKGNALTPSEERIATLASEGLRNRDIARRLAISEKTVEAALARVYGKLGIRSRAQLAAGLARAADRERRSAT